MAGAAALMASALTAVSAAADPRGVGGGARAFPNLCLARGGSGAEGASSGFGLSRSGAPSPGRFRLAFPPPRSQGDGRPVPAVSVQASRHFRLFLLKISLPDPKVYASAADVPGGGPDGRPAARNRTAELRSRTLLKYNVSRRIDFVGEAQGSRLRMLRLTLARLSGGADARRLSRHARYAPLSESEAALLQARERTVRRALAPHLTLPGISLNLGGISVQAGVRVRLF